ncbi:MAG: TldD/PmbA family protein [Lachnospiraceae bacterium]|nr:TldD/PmbA family protein [Lachnospiraceae bacterium]
MNKQAWLAAAKEYGFENFEIYQSVREERSFSWYNGQMDAYVTSSVTGTALRGKIDGRMVSFATENDDDAAMEEVFSQMREQSAAITSEEEAVILPPQDTTAEVSGKIWKRPDAASIRRLLSSLEQKISGYDPRVAQVTHLQWQEEADQRQITNSLGLEAEDAGRVQILVAGAAVVQDGEVKDDYLIEAVSDIDALDEDAFVKKLCDSALNKLGASSVKSGTYRVIFQKDAMTSLFNAFTDIFSGDRIGKGISPLAEKAGQQIFSDKITVIDDPRSKEAVSLMNYDDEGHPTARKVVVENGVFRTILHSTRSAARMKMQSTGNGFRSSYASAVSVRPMNCYIKPGEKTLDQLCEDMQEGIVVTDLAGLHAGLDHVTGDFSLQCSGYLVENGKRSRSVTLITAAGNFLEMMKNVTAVGSDLDWNYHSVVCPSIAFEGCAISGE